MPLRLIAGRMNTFGYDPPVLYQLFQKVVAQAGIDQVRISDPWNYLSIIPRKGRPFGWTDTYSKHDFLGFSATYGPVFCRENKRNLSSREVICFKDPGGPLTPERTRNLTLMILEAAGDCEVEFPAHCTTGLGSLCVLRR